MTDAIVAENLAYWYGALVAVDHISFNMAEGEILGFLGPNGAGKSTTIRLLCGILEPTSGGGQVGGFNIVKESEKIKEIIGYMSQKFSLYEDLTVEQNIDFYSGIYLVPDDIKKKRKEWVIEMAGLRGREKSLTRQLSGGWKQRLALGCAALHKPRIIFLDEPTAGVDPASRRKFWELIHAMAAEGVTVFVTTHYMDEAERCGRVALIYGGKIISIDTPENLKRKNGQPTLEDVFVHLIEKEIARDSPFKA